MIFISVNNKFSFIFSFKSSTIIFSYILDSFFNNPGVYEIDMGTSMKKIFTEIGGGFKEEIKAFQIGIVI